MKFESRPVKLGGIFFDAATFVAALGYPDNHEDSLLAGFQIDPCDQGPQGELLFH